MDLPQGVREFILRYINSVAELEGLLLMRSDAGHPWTAPRLAGRLFIDEQAAARVLAELHRAGLLTQDEEGVGYGPASDKLRAGVDALADAYPRFLISITQIIHTKPRGVLREFADAFRLREDT